MDLDENERGGCVDAGYREGGDCEGLAFRRVLSVVSGREGEGYCVHGGGSHVDVVVDVEAL